MRGFAVVHCIGILTSMFSACSSRAAWSIFGTGGRRNSRTCPLAPSGGPDGGKPKPSRAIREVHHGIFQDPPRYPVHAACAGVQRHSLVTFCGGVFLFSRGLHLSVEFTGGTLMEVAFSQPADLASGRGTVAGLGFGRRAGAELWHRADVMIRLPVQKAAMPARKREGDGRAQNGGCSATLRAPNSSARRWGRTGRRRPQGTGLVVVGIMIYLAIRFEWKFAVAAIIANLHDVIIILGFFAFFQWEFSLPVLAAVLAVLGYSVNESVVILTDRENFRRYRKMTTVQIIDNAITSTISRTIITHGCTQLMVLSMLLLVAPLHYFALAPTIGILFGIYSSVFVAAAIAMWLGVQREDLIKGPPKKDAGDPNDPNAGAGLKRSKLYGNWPPTIRPPAPRLQFARAVRERFLAEMGQAMAEIAADAQEQITTLMDQPCNARESQSAAMPGWHSKRSAAHYGWRAPLRSGASA